MNITPIATFHSPFTSKFGIPRQSGIVPELWGHIILTPKWRNTDAIRGLENFSHLWLIWEFSANRHETTSPMVRPPRLGGNKRIGVFASRSPYRPNRLGLSAVKLEKIDRNTPKGPVIHVSGADLMDGTPIYDIKPYITYADSIPNAHSGFTDNYLWKQLSVHVPENFRDQFSPQELQALIHTLQLDPRPHYKTSDDKRRYGMPYMGHDIHFHMQGTTLIIEPLED